MRRIIAMASVVIMISSLSLFGFSIANGEGIVITISDQSEMDTLPYENQVYMSFHAVGESITDLGYAIYNAYALQTLRSAYQYYDASSYAYPYIHALSEGCNLEGVASDDELMIAYDLIDEYSMVLNGNDIVKSFSACDKVEHLLAYTPNECVRIIWVIFKNRGALTDISDGIEAGKAALKQVDNDFRYYEQLKIFYSTVKNYYEFLQNPSVSLVDMKDRIEQYNQSIEDCENILAFEFE